MRICLCIVGRILKRERGKNLVWNCCEISKILIDGLLELLGKNCKY